MKMQKKKQENSDSKYQKNTEMTEKRCTLTLQKHNISFYFRRIILNQCSQTAELWNCYVFIQKAANIKRRALNVLSQTWRTLLEEITGKLG